MGALSTRFGFDGATYIGYIHEDNSRNPEEERQMDLKNNSVGAELGQEAITARPDDQWGYVLEQCEARARSYELYDMNGVKGNY